METPFPYFLLQLSFAAAAAADDVADDVDNAADDVTHKAGSLGLPTASFIKE